MLPYDMFEIREFMENDHSLFGEWFNGLDAVTAARIDRHIRRLAQGNMGDSKSVGAGVRELRIHFGSGYRVYYGKEKGRIIILLGGGSKRGQKKDIAHAIARWESYKKQRK